MTTAALTEQRKALEALPPLRALLQKESFLTHKGLGQHFLLDLNITRKIVGLAGDLSASHAIEIGPGPGGLTRALLESEALSVTALEKDSRCAPLLAPLQEIAKDRFQLVFTDALQEDLTQRCPAPRVVVANLPYNVGTALLLQWLEQIAHDPNAFQSLTLMFQAEVVDRIVAEVGTKAYGRLALISQFCCNVKRVMTIPARAFTPPPKIDSAVVHLTPRLDRPKDVSFEALGKVTAAAFGQRRKMLRASLKPLCSVAFLESLGIDPEARAGTLPLHTYETLARRLFPPKD